MQLNTFNYGICCIINLFVLTQLLNNYVKCDEEDNEPFTNGLSIGLEFTTPEFDYSNRGSKKFGDKCDATVECGFPGSICDSKKKSCQCIEELPVTNHIDKCGKESSINETCFFNEQCEAFHFQTECRDNRCVCRFEMSPTYNKDGNIECKAKEKKEEPERYIDPAMIGVLVGMALMFVVICVVLRLFSRARWRENRTIFNTPNPRLMNVSLLRESKILHGQERRGSRMSVRGPSRQPSMASLRPHSPNPSLGTEHKMTRSKSNTKSNDSRTNETCNPSRIIDITTTKGSVKSCTSNSLCQNKNRSRAGSQGSSNISGSSVRSNSGVSSHFDSIKGREFRKASHDFQNPSTLPLIATNTTSSMIIDENKPLDAFNSK